MTIQDEYLYNQIKYEKLYGKNCIVLMQVGSFHECYSFDDNGPNLSKISELLDVTLTKKNKKEPMSKKNPQLLGFPSVAIDKYIKKLIINGYTVPVFDQTTEPPDPRRELVNIYSPGTYIEESITNDSNNTLCIYIEDEYQQDKSFLICIGLSVIDVSTGNTVIYEVLSKKKDKNIASDEAVRFINSYNPSEIIVYRKKPSKDVDKKYLQTKDDIINYLELNDKNFKYFEKIDKKWSKLSYREASLKKIFKTTGIYDSVIEYLDLEKKPYCTMSLILLFEFINVHNDNLLKKIKKPSIFESEQHLILGNNAINQLNIIRSDISLTTFSKFKSLFDVVNKTVTHPGRRFLKNRLCNPITDHKKLKKSYNTINIIKNKHINTLHQLISGIVDIERLHRKLSIGTLHPHELNEFIKSYKKIIECFNFIKSNKKLMHLIDNDTFEKICDFIKFTDKTFNYNKLEIYKLTDIENSIFNKGIFPNIDTNQNKIDDNISFMNNITSVLSSYIKDSSNNKKNNNDNKLKIKLENNKNEGYYLKTTAIRSNLLKKEISILNKIPITSKMSLDPKKLQFKTLKGSTKIIYDGLEKMSLDTQYLRNSLTEDIIYQYKNTLEEISNKYNIIFQKVSDILSEIDFYLSSAKIAKEYNYCKPIIKYKNDYGFINTDGLRHPIIERITDSEYVPHNIKLGTKNDIDGMLIFGLNSSGKSSLMKAVGLSIVMAQSGMFVPATEFYFSPFTSLFARITGNDNIFKGLSSFALEMVELDAILKRTSRKTLVIGDEVCRGTESISGNAIVASVIIQLSKTQTPFMFATHLHKIPQLDEIKELNNIKSFHLTVEKDIINNKLIFDRKLKKGPGDSIYGITVAKHIVDHKDFILEAENIRNKLINKSDSILNNFKTSRYNSKVVMDCCQVCGKKTKHRYEIPLDTHHINYQKNCDKGFVISKPHIKMNSKSNLAVLCKTCHTKEHNGQIKIFGYKKTSKGIELEYEKN